MADLSLDDAPDVLTVSELARLLRVSRNAAYQLVADGQIYAAHIGRSLRIPKTAAVAFLQGDMGEPELRVVGRSGSG